MQRNVHKQSSSGDSQKGGQSDAEKWFNQSNKYATATDDGVDVEPPFSQKQWDSSNGDETNQDHQYLSAPLRHASFTPSSACDFRSVIDDLSIEIRRLKDELKRYKLAGPGALRGDTLFEIKIHGLPKEKKRELCYTLQEFAASLGDAPESSSAPCKIASKHAKGCGTGWGSVASLESSAPPPDSAYASISNGTNTSVTSATEAATSSRNDSSKRKADSFLRDIPEGLYPGHMAMTDMEKQIIVVRRLEHLFTGQTISSSASALRHTNHAGAGPSSRLAPLGSGNGPPRTPFAHHLPSVTATERGREAMISAFDHPAGRSLKRSKAKTTGSASALGGVQAGFNDDGNIDSSTNYTLQTNTAPRSKQRPTRIKELDPERVQIPSEIMEYIRHLGLSPFELSSEDKRFSSDGHPDVGGWVYLTLLCNLAQLHLINVTPSFVRVAVKDISTKLQLSPDERKIRWRGNECTRPSTDWVDNITQSTSGLDGDDVRTERNPNVGLKAACSTGLSMQPGSSRGCASKTGHHIGALGRFYYKPLFFQQDSPAGQSNGNDTSSTLGFIEHRDNIANSSSCLRSTTALNSRERPNPGAIIYYTRASFCTDLSGHSADASPSKFTHPSALDQLEGPCESSRRALLFGPPLAYGPLTDSFVRSSGPKVDVLSSDEPLGMSADTDNSAEVRLDVSWSDHEQVVEIPILEPCGLGGVTAEDHFRVVVTTRRQKHEAASCLRSPFPVDTDIGGTIQDRSSRLEIEHVSDRTEHLSPVLPPPPAHYFTPCSTDDSSANGDDRLPTRLNVLARAQEPP
ncbi:hypothetical protein PCL_12668 [Purpureocillium lilacinum]|uniref:Frequency clock protein n=1 Tax=Purpureocillium lilacinum TaxID=33203 RepID=A0A2U3DPC0_PURLI|nr:hypothetical protein PCL_12668 [Purpureocillium lilacinum]